MLEYMKLLGLKGRDKVTGYEGVIEVVAFDLYGCVMVQIVPKVGEDGKRVDTRLFDHKRIDVISRDPVMPIPEYEAFILGKEPGPADRTGVDYAGTIIQDRD